MSSNKELVVVEVHKYIQMITRENESHAERMNELHESDNPDMSPGLVKAATKFMEQEILSNNRKVANLMKRVRQVGPFDIWIDLNYAIQYGE